MVHESWAITHPLVIKYIWMMINCEITFFSHSSSFVHTCKCWHIHTQHFSTYGPRYFSISINFFLYVIVKEVFFLCELLPIIIVLMEGVSTWLLSVKMSYHRWRLGNFVFSSHYFTVNLYVQKIKLVYFNIIKLSKYKIKHIFNLF